MSSKSTTSKETGSRPPLILLSLDSYKKLGGAPPPTSSIVCTGVIMVIAIICSEMLFRYLFLQMQDWHPVMEPQVNRHILARHIGADTLSLLLLALMGWQGRAIVWGIFELWCFGKKSSHVTAAYLKRVYTAHPEGVRISMFFLWYQVKNLYDTIVWDDGIEFVLHHIFSIFTSWVVLGPNFCHYYAIFFFGLSEISTCVLCVLANFDDEHGVVGLGDAFPLTKVAVGAVFVVLFILCRCTMWPIISYHFCQDASNTLKDSDPRTNVVRRRWLNFLYVSLSFMSVLQAAWLGQIFLIAKEEFTKVGLIS